jgi:hypothetical protein
VIISVQSGAIAFLLLVTAGTTSRIGISAIILFAVEYFSKITPNNAEEVMNPMVCASG